MLPDSSGGASAGWGTGVTGRCSRGGSTRRGMQMAKIDPWVSGSRIRLRDDFVSGLKCYRNEDWEGALGFFRSAAAQAGIPLARAAGADTGPAAGSFSQPDARQAFSWQPQALAGA